MAKMENGILGGFVGKVGNVVGYRYKGQYYIRQVPRKSHREPSLAQRAQQAKFALVRSFLEGLRPLLQALPDRGRKRMSAFNDVCSKLLTNAVTGSYPESSIDYANVQFSAGSMNTGACQQLKVNSRQILFTACLPGWADELSLVTLLVFNVTQQVWRFKTVPAGNLLQGAPIDLPCNFAGDRVETWLFLSSGGFKKQSPTVYMGSHTIPGHVPCSLNPLNQCL